jgi:isoquinoline 1-oxidoreductase subunit alpha
MPPRFTVSDLSHPAPLKHVPQRFLTPVMTVRAAGLFKYFLPPAADAFSDCLTNPGLARLQIMAGNFRVRVNGRTRTVRVEPDTPLLWVLRDVLRLTGTKYGCGEGVCGACTVHENHAAVRSCQVPISQANGRSYTTIEGLGGEHPCQRAWLEEDVAQCGYCQTGMIMTAAALLAEHPHPTDAQIDSTFAASLCRCGTYQRIRKAIHRAAVSQ